MPSFHVDTIVIGVPAIIVAGIGACIAASLVYKISLYPAVLADNGDPERKKMSDTIVKLQAAIAQGARVFLYKEYTYLFIVGSLLFVLVSAAVNWRTGLW